MKQQPNLAILALTMLVGALLACSLQQQPAPIIITATPDQPFVTDTPIIITATPEIPPTLAPVPTPTVPPDEGLNNAEQALRNGDYETAVVTFQRVLNDPFLAPDMRGDAAFSLGQAAVREGLFQAAVDSFSDFIARYPDDSRRSKAYFMRGDAYLGLGAWEAAITDFEEYLRQRPGVIDSYAHERIGDAYTNLGNATAALNAYQAAVNEARSVPSLVALRERLAAAYINSGQVPLAIAQYDAILKDARNNGYRANIEYQAAQLEIQVGRTELGQARMAAMIELYPATPAAYRAMQDLLRAGRPVDDWLRAQIAFSAEDYQDVITTLNRYTTQLPVAPVEALMMLARAYRAVGNYAAANTSFQTILDQYTTNPIYGEAFLEQGRTLFLAGDTEGAINRYMALFNTNPSLSQAPEALWRAGYLYSQAGDMERALSTFETLSSNYPNHSRSADGLLLAATMAYNAGQVQRAQGYYVQLANSNLGGSNQAQALLWLGRLYTQAGQNDQAAQSFRAASQANPGGYFSVRADDLLNNRQPFEPPNNYRFEFDDAQEIAEAEAWLRETFSIEGEGALYPLSESLEQDPRMIRGRELWELGDFEAAKTEFENLRESVAEDALLTYQLAVYYADIGLYRSSITAAAHLIATLASASDFEAPRYLVRLRYPIHYADLVLPAAERWNVDPLLVFALIRQESLYEGFARSVVGAQGLMQIMPATGAEINERINWSPDYQNSDVYRPYINVNFGAFYLSWVKDYVDGQPYAALAGYNGGPGNARAWLNISGPDLDLFVQTITFPESKLYVERIYEQYAIYRSIYGID